MLVNSEDLAGPGDLAKSFSVGLPAIYSWRQQPRFPEPVVVLSSGPVWSLPTVKRWLEQYGPRRSVHRHVRFYAKKMPDSETVKRGKPRWLIYDRITRKPVPDHGPYTSRDWARKTASRLVAAEQEHDARHK